MTGCHDFGTEITVKNESDYNLDSIFVTNGFNFVQFKKLDKGGIREDFVDFSQNSPKYDGNYRVKLYYNDLIKTKSFGYYSNGIPSEAVYEIIVKNDTIIIEEIYE